MIARADNFANDHRRRGIVLLEVVIAMAMFFSAAAIILGGLSQSGRAMMRLKIEAQAADLAVTKLSEVQMRIVPLVSDGPTAYLDPMQDWSWQLVVESLDNPSMDLPEFKRLVVIITHAPTHFTYRLQEIMSDAASGDGAADSSGASAGGGEGAL